MVKKLFLIFVVLLLAGCTDLPTEEDFKPIPMVYEIIIREAITAEKVLIKDFSEVVAKDIKSIKDVDVVLKSKEYLDITNGGTAIRLDVCKERDSIAITYEAERILYKLGYKVGNSLCNYKDTNFTELLFKYQEPIIKDEKDIKQLPIIKDEKDIKQL